MAANKEKETKEIKAYYPPRQESLNPDEYLARLRLEDERNQTASEN